MSTPKMCVSNKRLQWERGPSNRNGPKTGSVLQLPIRVGSQSHSSSVDLVQSFSHLDRVDHIPELQDSLGTECVRTWMASTFGHFDLRFCFHPRVGRCPGRHVLFFSLFFFGPTASALATVAEPLLMSGCCSCWPHCMLMSSRFSFVFVIPSKERNGKWGNRLNRRVVLY